MQFQKLSTILVVDDRADQRSLICAQLGKTNFNLLTASNGQEGFEVALRGRPDLIISDVTMPGSDGIDLCRLVRAEPGLALVPILLVSGIRIDDASAIEGLIQGADDYLEIPYEKPLLIAKVTRLLERRRSEEALARFAAIVESSSVAIIGTSLDAIITSWNTGAERIYGYTAAEVIGQPMTILAPPDRVEEVITNTDRIRQGERVEHIEAVRLRKDGRTILVSLNISPIKDQTGKLLGGSTIVRDITDEKRIEEALRRSEDLYRDLVENSSDLLCTHDLEGRILSINLGVVKALGYPRQELLGQSVRQIIAPEHRAGFDAYLAEIRQTGSASGVMAVRTRTGEKRIWEYNNNLRTEGVAEPIVRGMGHDVTERMRVETALRQSEGQFRALFENTLDAVIIADDERRFIDANPAACSLHGLPREQLKSRYIEDFTPPDSKQDIAGLWRDFLQEGSQRGEIQILRPDGTMIQAEYTAKANFQPGRHLSVLRDITERRQLEEQLRQSQRLESVGKLAGGIAHDFNNLLTAIIGYSDLGLQQLHRDDPVLEYMHEIKRAGERASALTRQLLAFSRRQVLQPKIIDVNAIVTDMDRMLRRLIGEDIELRTALAPELFKIRADPGQIEQVVLNLVVNARDAMPDGGKLTIETGAVTLGDEYIRHRTGVQPGEYALLAVSDTGCGIPEQAMGHIFEPFFTTKAVGQGTGLGLSTVYGIVTQSGGHVWVYSEVGAGSTFKVYLPRVEAPEQEVAVVTVPSKSVGGTETILLVEDEGPVRKLTREILKSNGYNVLEAPNGRLALRLCEDPNNTIHLLLTDIVMPELGGRELAVQARQLRPGLPVLFMSGYTANAVMQQGMLGPGTEFINKPFPPAELLMKARKALDFSGLH